MMPHGERAVEELLKAVGGAWTQLPLLALLAGVCALNLNTQLLAFVTPDHWCYNTGVAAIQTQLPLSPQDAKKFSLPPVTIGLSLLQQWVPQNVSVTYSQCERYDGDLVAAYISWTAAKRPLFIKDIQGVSAPRNLSVRACDQGWVYNYTNFYTTLTTQSSWVCGDAWRPHFVHLAFWVAAGLGALAFGIIAERFGESLVIIVALSTTLAGQVLTLATTNFLSVTLARVVVGLPYLAIRFVSIAHVTGMSESRHRAWPFVVLLFSQTVTTLIVTATILAVSSWWFLALGSAVVCAVCLLVTWRLFLESPWWLLSRGRHAESQAVLYKMAALNRRQPPALDAENLQKLSELLQVAPRGSTMHCCCQDNIPFSLLEPRVVPRTLCRRHTVVLNLVWMLCGIGYYGHHQMSAHVLSAATNTRLAVPAMFQACWYTSLSELPACLLPFLLGHHHARWMTGSLVAATALLATAALMCTTVSTAGPLVVSALARLTLTCSLCAGLHLTYSLRDTRLGLMNVAVTESLVGFATAVAPVLNYMGEYNHRLPPLLLACVSLLGAMLSLALPSGTTAACLTENHDNLFHRARRLIQQRKLRAKMKTSRQDTNPSPCVSYNQLYFT